MHFPFECVRSSSLIRSLSFHSPNWMIDDTPIQLNNCQSTRRDHVRPSIRPFLILLAVFVFLIFYLHTTHTHLYVILLVPWGIHCTALLEEYYSKVVEIPIPLWFFVHKTIFFVPQLLWFVMAYFVLSPFIHPRIRWTGDRPIKTIPRSQKLSHRPSVTHSSIPSFTEGSIPFPLSDRGPSFIYINSICNANPAAPAPPWVTSSLAPKLIP